MRFLGRSVLLSSSPNFRFLSIAGFLFAIPVYFRPDQQRNTRPHHTAFFLGNKEKKALGDMNANWEEAIGR
jgi:hypothetical protein